MIPSTLLNILRAALERKQPLLAKAEVLRLLNAEASGVPKLVLELYGSHVVVYDYGAEIEKDFQPVASQCLQEFGWESIVLLDRTLAGDEGRNATQILAGTPPEKLIVREGTLHFSVEPRHPRNVGLFLDTRELRTGLHENSKGTRVLNLFSYTCSLGLAALSGGADEVINVDVSQRYLDWGRENLLLNNLPEEKCRFKVMDSERYLDWAAKKNLLFDQVILDPPVFSRFEGKTFRFANDYFRLASKSLTLLSPGGGLHAVTNFSGIESGEFRQRLEECVKESGRALREIRRIPLPPDFDIPPGSEIRPEGNALIFQVRV